MTPATTASRTHPPMPLATLGLIVVSLLWAGMLAGVSFLATPAKFLAPSLELGVALDVGRHTFLVFNRVEAVTAVLLLVCVLLRLRHRLAYALLFLPCALVLLQALWLLPALGLRTDTVIAGGTPPPSPLHTLYVAAELGKFIVLVGTAVYALRRDTGQPVAAHPGT